MVRSYFSDREVGARARINEEITPNVWQGTEAYINALISQGAFGNKFPENCPDGRGPFGTNEQAFISSLIAEIPDLDWPVHRDYMPDTLTFLDIVEFCFWAVAKPIKGSPHEFFGHYHLTFEIEEGQAEFRDHVNRIFARNGLVYELKENGMVERLAPPVLREVLNSITFSTGEATLDRLLESARAKYLDPDIIVRREALEKLWDAWERLKTIENPGDKKASIKIVLDKAASLSTFRKLIEDEATARLV